MATSSVTTSSTEPDKRTPEDEAEYDYIRNTGWKALFTFTKRKHIPVLVAALFAALVSALTNPAIAIMFGFVFKMFTDFGAGNLTAPEFLHGVSKYCAYLTGFGFASWAASSFFCALFMSFGDLQAHSAREVIFNALLKKDMAWYDTRDSGTAALLGSAQM